MTKYYESQKKPFSNEDLQYDIFNFILYYIHLLFI